MIFRIDDVNPNTDMKQLELIVSEMFLMKDFEKVILGVTVLAKENTDQAVYPSPPFKDQPLSFFYKTDRLMNVMLLRPFNHCEIASHGLIHSDHSQMSKEAQELSILTSCGVLNAKTFIPPFNKYNSDTEKICTDNQINLIRKEDGFRSLDKEVFVNDNYNPAHRYWYMHPWRWTVDKFREKVSRKNG